MFELVPVKLRVLPKGLYLDTAVYQKKLIRTEELDVQGEYSMLCENVTVTPELIARLQRVLFPSGTVYLPWKYMVEELFDKDIFLEFSLSEVRAIRNGEKFWDKSATNTIPISELVKSQKAGDPAKEEPYAKKLREVIEQYNGFRNETEKVIEQAAVTGKVNKDQCESLSKEMREQVNLSDPAMIIQTISRIRDEDEYLLTHSLNVAFLNGLMGKWMRLDSAAQAELVEIGLLHDIGKLKVDRDILNKPSRLTEEEFAEIKKHPVLSLETLIKSGIKNKTILDGVIQHHEKVNGTGYPLKLDAVQISEFARVTAISDIYDAMVTKRVYKDPHSPFVILNEFAQEGYSELDIKYVNIFINCMIEELKGKEIIMNDGKEAQVLLVNPRNLLYPIVNVSGKVVETGEKFHCVRMKHI